MLKNPNYPSSAKKSTNTVHAFPSSQRLDVKYHKYSDHPIIGLGNKLLEEAVEGEVQVGAKLLQHLRHLNWFRRKFLHGNLLHLHQYISVLVLTVLNCRRPISEKPSVGCCSTIMIASRRPPVLRKMKNITFKKEEKDLSRAADQLSEIKC